MLFEIDPSWMELFMFLDNDEFHRWSDNWRSAVVSMPGEKSAPAAKESVQVLKDFSVGFKLLGNF